MLSVQWPWLLILLPIPLLVRWRASSYDSTAGAIRVPFYDVLQNLNLSQTAPIHNNWLGAVLIWSIWLSLVLAAAKPTWVGEPTTIPQDQRDMMLAVDISRSMLEDDMLLGDRYTDRLTAVKAVVGEFVKERAGDRLGLILFGQQGYLQTPLTYDGQTVNQQLQEAQAGFAGNATAIGDAIGLAIKRLRDRPADSRVLILLTDGANTAGTDPLQATSIAAEAGVRIYTVGVGADVKYVKDFFGRQQQTNPSTDLDEVTLQNIADKTGGRYFRARNPEELQNIYAELDRLEAIENEQTFRPTRSLSHWPILLALLLSTLLTFLIRRAGR